jgi:hypothetical protein
MVVKMLVIDSENTTKIEQNQEPIIGAAVKAQLEQTTVESQGIGGIQYLHFVLPFLKQFFLCRQSCKLKRI